MSVIAVGVGVALAAACPMILTLRKLHRLDRERNQALVSLAAVLRERQEVTLNLVSLCSGYLVMETRLIEAVVLSRYHAMQACSILARAKTETDLCWALARLTLAAEDHPSLAHHPDYRGGLEALKTVEREAVRATTAYNTCVERMDRELTRGVGSLAAPFSGVAPMAPFELDLALAREAMAMQLAPETESPWNAPVPAPLSTASVAFCP